MSLHKILFEPLERTEATGYGGVIALQELLKRLYPNKQSKMTIAIQGFGNVGYHFAEAAVAEGHKVIAVSDSKGGIIGNESEDGLDIPKQLLLKLPFSVLFLPCKLHTELFQIM